MLAALRRTWPDQGRRVTTGLIGAATLGLAPFVPHAHIYKQLVNLAKGQLTAPIDIFDFVLHGAPWVWLFVALALWLRVAVIARSQRAKET
jgi:hypothetical protein